ncbi:hypothetical protein [Neobacillus sp. 19]
MSGTIRGQCPYGVDSLFAYQAAGDEGGPLLIDGAPDPDLRLI